MEKTLNYFKITCLLCILTCSFSAIKAQVSIVNANISAYNISPNSLSDVNILNTGKSVQATLQTSLYNSSHELIMTVTTSPFTLQNGLNNSSSLRYTIAGTQYGSTNQAEYIKKAHVLPSGLFSYCIKVLPAGTYFEAEEYCQEIESDISTFLLLVNPSDKDTIDTPNPNLIWNHSEPFNLLGSGESFRMVVAELSADQNAEAGINVNTPILLKNNLREHMVSYPVNNKALVPGKRYGWQVQQMSNGRIINKSEAWEFTLRIPRHTTDIKYFTLQRKLDGGFYTIENNRLFFRFDEEYTSNKLNYSVYNSKMEKVKTTLINENQKDGNSDTKNSGHNRFGIEISELDATEGLYLLEVSNEKNEKFMLRFLIK